VQQDNKRHIAILGSTGSIGIQALEVIRQQSHTLVAEVLIANTNAELLIQQSLEFMPNVVVIINEDKYAFVKESLAHAPIKVYTGVNAACDILGMDIIDIVLTAAVGFAGLLPTLAAIKAKKTIALANKETLVVAGDIVTQLARENAVNLLPVDSEHSAIFQCLAGEFQNKIEKIILTASGGPFRGKTKKELDNIKLADALKHPNWIMGPKITIDSATLVNKGLESIEAMWLFGLQPSQIEVIIHPQSIIHSLVQFTDGSMKAQLGLPDMKLPIQYALCYPLRQQNQFPRFDFLKYPQLNFEPVDHETFPGLALALQSMEKGGNMPCIFNAANEVAVDLFLNHKIKFLEIPKIISKAINTINFINKPSLDDYIHTDMETRKSINYK